ncbi:hypothetical protein [Aeromonas bestiarum]|uniref:hypothetical protein n=1 Tax=Aeromonas bestiarum TaxID=105751 RepID=UPI0011AF4AF9|nr:hypothetical protein [Aeromonas bestiarum]
MERKFLVTAGHVVNEFRNSLILVGVHNELIGFNGDIFKTSGSDKDKIDIAVLEVVGDNFNKINVEDCVQLSMLAPENTVAHKKIYSFIGYPATKAKIDRNKIFSVKSKMYKYFDTTCNQSVYADLSLSENTHILINFNAKKCKDESGQQVTFPKPNGMSGGGVWLHKDLDCVRQPTTEYLAGVAIEYHANKNCMLGVSIEAVIEVLKKKFGLSCFNSRSTSFNIIE